MEKVKRPKDVGKPLSFVYAFSHPTVYVKNLKPKWDPSPILHIVIAGSCCLTQQTLICVPVNPDPVDHLPAVGLNTCPSLPQVGVALVPLEFPWSSMITRSSCSKYFSGIEVQAWAQCFSSGSDEDSTYTPWKIQSFILFQIASLAGLRQWCPTVPLPAQHCCRHHRECSKSPCSGDRKE